VKDNDIGSPIKPLPQILLKLSRIENHIARCILASAFALADISGIDDWCRRPRGRRGERQKGGCEEHGCDTSRCPPQHVNARNVLPIANNWHRPAMSAMGGKRTITMRYSPRMCTTEVRYGSVMLKRSAFDRSGH
jgi:hypothetical protein